MRVKKRLRINNLIIALSVVATVAVLLATFLRVDKAMKQNLIGDALIAASFERLALRTDYLRTGSERAREQWSAKHEQIGALLKSASESFPNAGDRRTIAVLMENQESVGNIFRAIVANRQNADQKGRNTALSAEIEDRLLTQLNARIYELVIHGGKLQESSNAAIVSSLSTGGGWIAFVFLLMGAATLINSVSMNRVIANRIGTLRDGASAIGSGNLDHRIDIRGEDEFAELAGSFNESAAKLRSLYLDLKKEIEERKQAEAALRESEERFRLMGDSIPYGAWMADAEGRNIYISPLFLELVGMTFEQVKEFGWTDKMPPEDVEPTMRRWTECVRTGCDWEGELRFPSPDGRWHTILSRGRPVRDAQGQIKAWVGINLDITERKQAEQALRNSEEKFAKVFAMNPAAIAMTRPEDGMFVDVNESWLSGLGYSRDEVVGNSSLKVNLWASPEQRVSVVKELLERGSLRNRELTLLRKSGEPRVVLNSSEIITLGGKQVLVASWIDITERKRAEEALRESEKKFSLMFQKAAFGASLAELPDSVIVDVNEEFLNLFGYSKEEVLGKTSLDLGMNPDAETRSRMIAELQLPGFVRNVEMKLFTKAREERFFLVSMVATEFGGKKYNISTLVDVTDRKRAEEAIRASLREKEVLLKEVHHRVKNNLQVISSLVGMQCDISKDETVRGVLSDVTDRVRSMALVHEKLYQSENLARIDFAEYARSLLSYLWRAHGAVAADVRLTLDMEPVSLSVETAVPCGLLLNELAGNALKHAFRGRSAGEVIVALKGNSDGRTVLSVRDNGVGLPPGFDWRQARSLGLRLVQMLAGQLDATVEVHDGEGTRFELVFGKALVSNA